MSVTNRSAPGWQRRRVLLSGFAVLVVGCSDGGGIASDADADADAPCPVDGRSEPDDIGQPPVPGPAAFASAAEEQRRRAIAAGDQAFGAVIVRGDRIVGVGPSRVVVGGDPTAHAEIEAVRDAARRLGSNDLSGCELYSTSPPCPMCESAAYWARVALVRSGPGDDGGRAPRLGGREPPR
jgi:tRNA(Arg) A34 adenosine deaminase TadA